MFWYDHAYLLEISENGSADKGFLIYFETIIEFSDIKIDFSEK
jgi:hypothetical protein